MLLSVPVSIHCTENGRNGVLIGAQQQDLKQVQSAMATNCSKRTHKNILWSDGLVRRTRLFGSAFQDTHNMTFTKRIDMSVSCSATVNVYLGSGSNLRLEKDYGWFEETNVDCQEIHTDLRDFVLLVTMLLVYFHLCSWPTMGCMVDLQILGNYTTMVV